MLSKDAVKEFIELYKKEFGVVLTWEEGVARANKVVAFFKVLNEK